jgi:NMD protein affecting ribosome stability and mRNA decay
MAGKEIYEGKDQYFEGTLQIRDPTQEVIDFIENDVENTKGVHIAKILKVRNGYDFLMSSQRYLRAVGKKLQEKFPGDLKHSRKIFTRNRQTSKEVYRVTVMFRPSGLHKGDTLIYRGEETEVVGFGGKVQLKIKKTGKRITCNFDDPYLRT